MRELSGDRSGTRALRKVEDEMIDMEGVLAFLKRCLASNLVWTSSGCGCGDVGVLVEGGLGVLALCCSC